MEVLLVIHVIIVVCLIGVILLQRSSNDGFTGGGNTNSLMSGRASANLLTRTTAILATAFMVSSLVLAYIAASTEKAASIIGDSDVPAQEEAQEPASSPEATPEQNAPEVPIAE